MSATLLRDRVQSFIDGAFVESSEPRWWQHESPRDGQPDFQVSSATREDLERAMVAGQRAQPAWAALGYAERGRWLEKLARACRVRLEEFAELESADGGKILSLARDSEIPRAIANLEFFAEFASTGREESRVLNAEIQSRIERVPLGVVGTITPWNLPFLLFTWKLAPALMMGNVVVAKPSEYTPRTAALLCEVAAAIGFPRGVLQVLQGPGPEVGEALVNHSEVRAISFTGSTRVGREIGAKLGSTLKKLSLELGGKNATVLLGEHFDPKSPWDQRMIREVVRSAFQNQGQICLCGSRVYVRESVYEKVRAALLTETERWVADGNVGPLVSKPHFERVSEAIARAKTEGGKMISGGSPLRSLGLALAPTWIEGLEESSATVQTEIFGPVVTLHSFRTDEEVVRRANAVEYGLASTVWDQDLPRARKIASQLESGLVWINHWMSRDLRLPFGGMKASGLGREGGEDALRFFSEPRSISEWQGEV